MKKVIKTMMMMLVASAFVLTSCKDDETTVEDVKLTLNPSATSGTHAAGSILKIVINAKGNDDNKLKTLTITKAPSGSPTVTLASEKLSGTDKIYDLIDTLPPVVPPGQEKIEITYTIKLEGEKGTAQTATYVATVVNLNPIQILPADQLSLKGQTQEGSQHFMDMSQEFNAYSTDLTAADWANNVDLAYFFGTENKHTITSPDNKTMQGLYSGLSGHFADSRKTGFYKISATEGASLYNKVVSDNNDAALVAYANGKVYTDIVNNLAPNDVILYRTEDGELGLIKIGNASGISASNADLPFQALVQIK